MKSVDFHSWILHNHKTVCIRDALILAYRFFLFRVKLSVSDSGEFYLSTLLGNCRKRLNWFSNQKTKQFLRNFVFWTFHWTAHHSDLWLLSSQLMFSFDFASSSSSPRKKKKPVSIFGKMDKVVAKKGISVEKENKSYRRRHSSSSSSASTRSRSHSRGHNSRRKTRYQHRRSRTHRRSRSYTRSPSYHRRIRYYGSRENPYKSRVVGIFGLCPTTNEAKLMEIFSPFGTIEHVSIIHDAKTGNSRGFGFIYYAQIDQASLARSNCNGMTLEGKIIRVDYSITKRAHTPTPGILIIDLSTSWNSKVFHRNLHGLSWTWTSTPLKIPIWTSPSQSTTIWTSPSFLLRLFTLFSFSIAQPLITETTACWPLVF